MKNKILRSLTILSLIGGIGSTVFAAGVEEWNAGSLSSAVVNTGATLIFTRKGFFYFYR